MRRHFLVLATILCGVTLAAVGCTSSRESSSPTRSDLARDAAVGVVAAIARPDVGDVSHYFGRSLLRRELMTLRGAVDTTLNPDPIAYEVRLEDNSAPDDVATATVTMTMVSPPGTEPIEVTLAWDARKPREIWDRGKQVGTAYGDWRVTGVALAGDPIRLQERWDMDSLGRGGVALAYATTTRPEVRDYLYMHNFQPDGTKPSDVVRIDPGALPEIRRAEVAYVIPYGFTNEATTQEFAQVWVACEASPMLPAQDPENSMPYKDGKDMLIVLVGRNAAGEPWKVVDWGPRRGFLPDTP